MDLFVVRPYVKRIVSHEIELAIKRDLYIRSGSPLSAVKKVRENDQKIPHTLQTNSTHTLQTNLLVLENSFGLNWLRCKVWVT